MQLECNLMIGEFPIGYIVLSTDNIAADFAQLRAGGKYIHENENTVRLGFNNVEHRRMQIKEKVPS